MTFDEFFAKKKIDLGALMQAEPALFSEFKTHFEQMGEKSFDHTKKYWFNKLRLQYHLAPEVKTEKVQIANPLAEQTITETLAETTSPPPNVGFKPRFKPGMTKPVEPATEIPPASPVDASACRHCETKRTWSLPRWEMNSSLLFPRNQTLVLT